MSSPKKITALLFMVAMLSIRIHGQQIGEIDLSRLEGETAEVQNQNVMPDGCGMPNGVHGDGVIVSPDPNKKPKIRIDLTLPKDTFRRGETVEGDVLMENVGADPILIPWNTDPRVSIRPKGTSEYAYEMGWFELKLKDGGSLEVPLESASQSNFLYSSATLNINSGEWATFKLRFVIDERRTSSARRPIKTGGADIAIEWRQARFEWKADGCNVNTGYFSYVYQEDAKPIRIKVAK
jgi:hypothetical protein